MPDQILGQGASAANPGQPLREVPQEQTGAATANPSTPDHPSEGQPSGEPSEAQQPQARPLGELFADDALYEDEGRYITGAELKGERMMERDYRQKTMAAAEERRQHAQQVETAVQALTANAQALAGQLEAQDRVLDQKVQQVQQAMHTASDPQTWQRLQQELQALGQQQAVVAQEYQQLTNQYKQSVQQARASQIQAAEGYLGATKWWNPEYHHGDLKAYAMQQGVSEQAFNETIDPTMVSMMHKARLYDEAQAKLKQAPTRQGKQLPKSTSAPAAQGQLTEEQAALQRVRETGTQADWNRWNEIRNRNKRNAQR